VKQSCKSTDCFVVTSSQRREMRVFLLALSTIKIYKTKSIPFEPPYYFLKNIPQFGMTYKIDLKM